MFNLTSKVLGYVAGGLGAIALAAGAFAGIQTIRLNGAQSTLTATKTALKTVQDERDLAITVANERGLALVQRDQVIQQQSTSIDALAASSDTARSTYLAGIAVANRSAQGNEARAAEIIQLPAPPADARCEAARALIEEEMLNVR